MENPKRTDLACEKNKTENADIYTETKRAFGITCIHAKNVYTQKNQCITVCTGKIWRYNRQQLKNTEKAILRCLHEIIDDHKSKIEKILICCLGNGKITADSLGAKVYNELIPSRHTNISKTKVGIIACGTEGQCGFTSFEAVTAYTRLWTPDLIIAIDSLCSRGTERQLSTVQISASGILPGSGVGKHKLELSRSTLGIPVLAIGVPTVTQYTEKVPESGCNDLYITHIELDAGVEAYSNMLGNVINSLYL